MSDSCSNEKIILDENKLASGLPKSLIQYLEGRLDDFREEAKIHNRPLNWKKPSNAKELEGKYAKVWPVFQDCTLNTLWTRLDDKKFINDFLHYLIHTIPAKYGSSKYAKKLKKDKKTANKHIEHAIYKLKLGNHKAFDRGSYENTRIHKILDELKEILKKSQKDLDSAWINSEMFFGINSAIWPSLKKDNEVVFYEKCLCNWFLTHLQRPHEKEVVAIISAIFPESDIDITHVSSNTEEIRKFHKSKKSNIRV